MQNINDKKSAEFVFLYDKNGCSIKIQELMKHLAALVAEDLDSVANIIAKNSIIKEALTEYACAPLRDLNKANQMGGKEVHDRLQLDEKFELDPSLYDETMNAPLYNEVSKKCQGFADTISK